MEGIDPMRPTWAQAPSPTQGQLALPLAAQPRPPGWLTPDERQTVLVLGRRDDEVRHGEFERLTEAGVWTRYGVDYEYRVGPDGRRYAVQAHPGMVAPLAPDPGEDNPAAPDSLDVSA